MQSEANTCLELEQARAEILRLKGRLAYTIGKVAGMQTKLMDKQGKLADMEKDNRIKTIELEMYHIRDEKASIEKDIAAKQEQKVELAQRTADLQREKVEAQRRRGEKVTIGKGKDGGQDGERRLMKDD